MVFFFATARVKRHCCHHLSVQSICAPALALARPRAPARLRARMYEQAADNSTSGVAVDRRSVIDRNRHEFFIRRIRTFKV